MKKRLTAVILIVMILQTTTLASRPVTGNFNAAGFTDVSDSDWYYSYVYIVSEYGIMQGRGDGIFAPNAPVTYGEAVKLAAWLHSMYTSGTADFTEGTPYYEVYVEYLKEIGFSGFEEEYDNPITRSGFVTLLSVLPESEFPAKNEVSAYDICDAARASEYWDVVYMLYRAGVLTGSDDYGAFKPYSEISRGEAAAILSRVLRPGLRVKLPELKKFSASEIYERSAKAAVMIETYDANGEYIRTGSGFFITETGLAVTNEHVLTGAVRAIVTLENSESYPMLGVCAIDSERDLAVFMIDSEIERFDYLLTGDSDLIKTGETVYVIGSPLGLAGSITRGIISYELREVGEEHLIQFSAPISQGSGGSAVVNERGIVVGVASSSFTSGQNLNLAVPINLLYELSVGECEPLSPVE